MVFLDHESTMELGESLFDSNYALNGGVVALRSSHMSTRNNTFANNSAHIGGALSISTESSVTCSDDQFIGNSVTDNGGCILLESNSFLNVTRWVGLGLVKNGFDHSGTGVCSLAMFPS